MHYVMPNSYQTKQTKTKTYAKRRKQTYEKKNKQFRDTYALDYCICGKKLGFVSFCNWSMDPNIYPQFALKVYSLRWPALCLSHVFL